MSNRYGQPDGYGGLIPKIIFRFDDVSAKCDLDHLVKLSNVISAKFHEAVFIYAISPLLAGDDPERIFPKIWNAYSDHKKFYEVDFCGIPAFEHSDEERASHGLAHVDHRLLDYAAQEMSILVSCHLLKCKIFVPPFNKYNNYTREICKANGIELITFESGWKCAEYNHFDPEHKLWYLHAREFTIESFTKWINQK